MTSMRGAFVALVLFVLLGCQSPTSDPEFAATGTTPRNVLVAPLNLTIRPPGGFEADPDPVWQALIAHLEALGLEPIVLDELRSEVLWDEVMTDLADAGRDPSLRTTWSIFARRAGEISKHGGKPLQDPWVLLPSLILRSAPVRGREVSWDGVHRDFQIPFALDHPSRSTMGAPSGVGFDGYRGQLAAASLHVAVLTHEGRLFWEGLGGLDVVQEIDSQASAELDGWRFQLRPQPFAGTAHVREGVALAFARRLPGSARLAQGDMMSEEGEQSGPPASFP